MLELRSQISDTTGSDPADRVEIRGDVLQEWHGLDQFLPESSFQDIIFCFEANEMRTSQAYQKALNLASELDAEVSRIIRNQLDQVWRSFVSIQEAREKPFVPETLPETNERKPPAFFHDRLYAEV